MNESRYSFTFLDDFGHAILLMDDPNLDKSSMEYPMILLLDSGNHSMFQSRRSGCMMMISHQPLVSTESGGPPVHHTTIMVDQETKECAGECHIRLSKARDCLLIRVYSQIMIKQVFTIEKNHGPFEDTHLGCHPAMCWHVSD